MSSPRSTVCVGAVFYRLTVLSSHVEQGRTHCRVKCACGKEKTVRLSRLTSAQTKSCGCLAREVSSLRLTTHGATKSPAYQAWDCMLRRSRDRTRHNWASYGGRGITVCPEWRKFENFLLDMGQPPEGLQLDRRDNSLGYSKENCRWVTSKENNRNRRNTLWVWYEGKEVPLGEASERSGIPYDRLYQRLKKGTDLFRS